MSKSNKPVNRDQTDGIPEVAWRRFEHEVRDVLELTGFEVESDVLIDGAQTDLRAEHKVGGITTRVLVECKFSEDERPVSVDTVENFSARVLVLRSKDEIDHGFLVTNGRFSRFAHAAAKHSFVSLMTVSDLYRRIFNFMPYATEIKRAVESGPILRTYIPARMSETGFEVSEDLDGTISVKRTLSREAVDIAEFCDNWMKESGGGRICLLGDYGAGKTTFCTWYAYRQAGRYLSNPEEERIPLLISLRQYYKAFDVKTMVTDFLVNECRISNVRLMAFEALLRRGLFLVIIDGFDEMARYVDREARYRTIADLGWLSQGSAKVILTGRPSYFPSHEELLQVLSSSENEDVYESARSALYELVEYRLYEVQAFDEEQIRKFVELWMGDQKDKAKRVLRYIRETYNLLDLASRPVLLDMIVKSLPRLLANEEKPIINAAKLYDIYTGAWIDRESQKGEFRRLINKEQKLKFMEELAFQLFTEEREALTDRQLGRPIREFFNIPDDERQDFFSHDIRTCAFLHRRTSTGYEFAHRSFQEFFLAKKLLSDVHRGIQDSWEARPLPPEVVRFISELIVSQRGSGIEQILSWIKQAPTSALGRNCVWVSSLANYLPPIEAAQAFDMEGKLLASSIAFQSYRLDEGRIFEEFLFRRTLARVRNFLEREALVHLVDEREIVHDQFLSIVAVLRGKAPRTLGEIDEVIASNIRWAYLGDVRRAANRREILFSDLPDIFEDILWDGEAAPQEREVFVREILGYIKKSDPFAAEIVSKYYLEGESIRELARLSGNSVAVIRGRLLKGVSLGKELVKSSKND